VFIVGVRVRAGIAVLARDTGRWGSSLGGSPEGRAERRNLHTPGTEVLIPFVSVSTARWWLLDAAVSLTNRRLDRHPLGCLGAVTDYAGCIAARGQRRWLCGRSRSG
jgi:hypothetical protein